MKANIRILGNAYPPVCDVNDNRFTGGCAHAMNSLLEYPIGMHFNYTLIATTLGVWTKNVNGSWTGIVGMFQRREVDFIVTSLGWQIDVPFMKMTVPTGLQKALIAHAVDPHTKKTNIFDCMESFDGMSWSLISMSIFFCTLIAKTVRSEYGLLSIIRYLLRQPIGLKSTARCLLNSLIITFFSFFVVSLFLNIMSSETAMKDHSNIIKTLDDVVRLRHIIPLTIRSNALYNIVYGIDNARKEIWGRMKRLGLDTCIKSTVIQLLEAMTKSPYDNVMLFYEGFFLPVSKSLCGSAKPLKIYRSPNAFYENVMTLTYSVISRKAIMQFAMNFGHRMAQSQISEYMIKSSSQKTVSGNDNCVKQSVGDLFDDIETLAPIDIARFLPVAKLFALLVAVSFVMLLASIYNQCTKETNTMSSAGNPKNVGH